MLNHAFRQTPLDRDPFSHGDRGRRLCLVIDDASVADTPPVRLLKTLAERASVRVYSTDPSAPLRLILEPPVDARDFVPVLLEGSDESIRVGIPGHRSIVTRAATLARENGGDRHEIERLLHLASLSRTNRSIDGVVLGEHVLSGPLAWHLVGAMAPAEGVALLGLNMRAHGDFAVSRDGNTTRVLGAEAFYRAVAFQHVESLEQWLASVVTRWHSGKHRPLSLLDGLATRLGRAFRARDYLQVRLRAHDFGDVWDEVLFFFDVVLVQLMGALDLLARLLHEVYALGKAAPSWRQRGKGAWLDKLAEHAPQIAARGRQGEEFGDIVYLVAELRNSIHEAPLSDEIHDWDGSPGMMVWGKGLVAIRWCDRTASIAAAAERRGGLTHWGLSDRSADQALTFDPGLYTEQAVRSTAAAIADVLLLADRERLAATALHDVSFWAPAQPDREHAAWLFGLQHGGLRQERVTSA